MKKFKLVGKGEVEAEVLSVVDSYESREGGYCCNIGLDYFWLVDKQIELYGLNSLDEFCRRIGSRGFILMEEKKGWRG